MGFDQRYTPGLAVLLAGTPAEAAAVDTLLSQLTVRPVDTTVMDVAVGASAEPAFRWLEDRLPKVAAEIARRKPSSVMSL